MPVSDATPSIVGRTDPRVQMNMPSEFQITLGGRTYTMTSQVCQGTGQAASSLNWNPVIPSPNVILCRTIYSVIQYSIGLTSSAANNPTGRPIFDVGTNDGPRFLPTLNAINTMTMTINGVPFSLPADSIPALARYWINPSDSSDMLSMTPSQLDQYSDIAKWQWYGQQRSALCSWGESNKPGDSRGGSISYVISNNTATSGQAYMCVVEPLFIPPLTQKIDAPGFSQIKNFSINLTMQSTMNRVWQRAPPVTSGGSLSNPFTASGVPGGQTGQAVAYGTGLQGSVPLLTTSPPNVFIDASVTQPTLIYMTITPQEGKSLPRKLTYDYSQWTVYTNDQTTGYAPIMPESSFQGAYSGQVSITSASLQLNTIPDEIYVWVGDTYASRTAGGDQQTSATGPTPAQISPIYQTDGYWRINNMKFTFNNDPSLMISNWATVGNGTNLDFYLIALRNGYQGSFQDFSMHTGTVICIRPGIDFGLPPGLVPGMTGVWNLQIQVNCQNISDMNRVPSLYVVPRTFGVMTIEAGQIFQNIGVVTEGMLSQAWANAKGTWMSPFTAGKVGFGGDFFDSIKKFGIKHVVPHLTWENGVKAYNFIKPYAQAAMARRLQGRGLAAPEGYDESMDLKGDGDEDRDFRHDARQLDDDHHAAEAHKDSGYEDVRGFKRRREERDVDPGFASARLKASSGIKFS